MPTLIQIALGGAIGAVLRYLLTTQAVRFFGAGFPVGTMVTNVAGSMVMGLIAGVVMARPGGGMAAYAPFLMTGLLGGFTTFSAYSLDSVLLISRGEMRLALGYVAGSVALSIAGLAAGLWFSKVVMV